MLLTVIFPFETVQGEDDFQYWSRYQVKLLDTEHIDFVNFWEFRAFEDASDVGLWYTSQKLIFDYFKNLQFGLNYTYLENESASPRSGKVHSKYQHRLELEANPHWKWGDWLRIDNRNRVEFRWIQDKGSDNGRYRQRWQVSVPVKNIPKVQKIYANNEVFWLFETGKVNENRLIPLGVSFKVTEKSSLSLFYMIQSRKRGGNWTSNQILGTFLSFKF